MLTLGVDPGTARLGYGVIRSRGQEREALAYGVLETSAAVPMPERLLTLHSGLRDVIEEFLPSSMAVERLFFARNVTTAIAVGQARGVILLAAAQFGIPVSEYTPAEIKQSVSGYGKADKGQMQEMVRLVLGLDHIPQPDDAADALAVALCHTQFAPFARFGAGT